MVGRRFDGCHYLLDRYTVICGGLGGHERPGSELGVVGVRSCSCGDGCGVCAPLAPQWRDDRRSLYRTPLRRSHGGLAAGYESLFAGPADQLHWHRLRIFGHAKGGASAGDCVRSAPASTRRSSRHGAVVDDRGCFGPRVHGGWWPLGRCDH